MSPAIERGRREPGGCPGGSEYGHGHMRTSVHAGGCCLRHLARKLGLPVELTINGTRLTIASLVPLAMWTGSLGEHLYIVARMTERSELYEARWHRNGPPGPALQEARGTTPEDAAKELEARMRAGLARLLDAVRSST